MTGFFKTGAALAAACLSAVASPSFAQNSIPVQSSDQPAVAQPVSYNGYTCDMVRAKVAEAGVAATYAYARYMGLTSRDIAKVRKACSV